MKANRTGDRDSARGNAKYNPSGRAILWSQSGQTLMEAALLVPVLLAVLIGGIELGRYAYISILVGNAATAGAQYGAESLPQSVATTDIKKAAGNDFRNNGQNVSTLTVTSTTSCGCDNAGTTTPAACSPASNSAAGTCGAGHWTVMVSVTAAGTFQSLFNYPGIPPTITISKTSTLRVNQD
ncbi:MAG: TadE/TadG family type IV pilus assembly protein [Candidatus Acidiferrales bacterium]